jgi:hypothetical protein
LHEPLQTCWLHPSQLPARVAPGAQAPCPPQVPELVHPPQAQDPLQVRVWACDPQLPQPTERLSVWPGAQTPSPAHEPASVHAPHVQSVPHVRIWGFEPQLPQPVVRVSLSPAMHSPPVEQAPNSPNAPQRQSVPHVRVRVWMPPPLQPHDCVSSSVAPGAHSPGQGPASYGPASRPPSGGGPPSRLVMHTHAPSTQAARQSSAQSSWVVHVRSPQPAGSSPVQRGSTHRPERHSV